MRSTDVDSQDMKTSLMRIQCSAAMKRDSVPEEAEPNSAAVDAK